MPIRSKSSTVWLSKLKLRRQKQRRDTLAVRFLFDACGAVRHRRCTLTQRCGGTLCLNEKTAAEKMPFRIGRASFIYAKYCCRAVLRLISSLKCKYGCFSVACEKYCVIGEILRRLRETDSWCFRRFVFPLEFASGAFIRRFPPVGKPCRRSSEQNTLIYNRLICPVYGKCILHTVTSGL